MVTKPKVIERVSFATASNAAGESARSEPIQLVYCGGVWVIP